MEMSDRFVQALRRTVEIHRDQLRKRTELDPKIPYVAHLLNVCGLVLQDGGSEDEAVAALLHDAAEDRGGEARLAEIEGEFGPTVAQIVAECSDTFETPKPPWRERKESYLAHLPEASRSALRVSVADKLDNARAILLDYERLGQKLWLRFDPEADQLWYYRSLVTAYQTIDGFDSPLIDELERTVSRLERLVTSNLDA
jgi:(p)ppGpp synthase/HD superfamily hydrolase